jgi:hypothetical protein
VLYRTGTSFSPMPRKQGVREHWSEEEDAILIAGISANETADSIAKQLDQRSVTTIETRMQWIRVSGSTFRVKSSGRWTDEEENLLLEMWKNQRFSYKDMAQRLGRSFGSKCNRIARLRSRDKDSPADKP